MIKRHNEVSALALTAVCAALAIAATPASAVPITMSYVLQAGFKSTTGEEEGFGPNNATIPGQGGLAFYTPSTPAAPPPPPDTWKGVSWGCSISTGTCVNPVDGNGTGFPDGTEQSTSYSSFFMASNVGTLTDTFQDVSTITHRNFRVQGNTLSAVDINLFLRLGPNSEILNGPNARVIGIDFFETLNSVGNPAACNIAGNKPPTGTGAPINPLGSDCDDYALISGANLASVNLPANSIFGNPVPATVDFRLNANISSGALVCNGVPGQQVGDCGSYVADPLDPKVIVYTAEGQQNTLTIQARIRGDIPDTRPVALFVIGDVEPHSVGKVVNFWGSQWWKNNDMSGFVSNGVASFKGYASRADNFCGGKWESRPGNSSDPPDTIPADVAIIVTDTVLKQGPNISGTIKEIVLVHHDGKYGPNPGHRGGGPVTQVLCKL